MGRGEGMSGARVLLKKVKMRVPAGNATAAPPVGPTLGQAGVNLMDFCKLFNARTAKYKENIDLPVKLFTYSDRSFEFHVSTPVRVALCASDPLPGFQLPPGYAQRNCGQHQQAVVTCW